MTAQTTKPAVEEMFTELARTIHDALTTRGESGEAFGRYVYDHNTPTAELKRRRLDASAKADAAVRKMWRAFYDVANEARELAAER